MITMIKNKSLLNKTEIKKLRKNEIDYSIIWIEINMIN